MNIPAAAYFELDRGWIGDDDVLRGKSVGPSVHIDKAAYNKRIYHLYLEYNTTASCVLRAHRGEYWVPD